MSARARHRRNVRPAVAPLRFTKHDGAVATRPSAILRPGVSVSVSWWGNIRELREVLVLAEKYPNEPNLAGTARSRCGVHP